MATPTSLVSAFDFQNPSLLRGWAWLLAVIAGKPALIRPMRLERASQLLQARAGPVSEIAYAVGYNSASYFSTAFREAFGHSPSEYFDNATF